MPAALAYTPINHTNFESNLQSTIVAVFFPTYTVFQPVMTVIARKIGPRIFMGFITVSWGLVMVGMGLVNDWRELAGLRVVLGFFEAGLFPAAVFLISSWYIRHETGKRIGLFYLLGSAISSFGGILAYGVHSPSPLIFRGYLESLLMKAAAANARTRGPRRLALDLHH
jgi:MFS family permease